MTSRHLAGHPVGQAAGHLAGCLAGCLAGHPMGCPADVRQMSGRRQAVCLAWQLGA